jgi:hypothetical protein
LAEIALHDRRTAVWLLSAALGCAVFFLWIGYARTLDPRDIEWIWHDDPFTHVMGWEQYRNAPLLQYPITKNELYGLEWSSSIVFTDSIPIAALVLRPLSAILPHPFQYLGWWVLLSLILQAYWAARLVLLRSDRLRDAALGSILFVTAPVIVERLGLQTGVGSHWLLLWALYRYFAPGGPATRSWTTLLLVTVSVHAYLFVMVGAIWIAHLAACGLRGLLSRRDLAASGATLAVVVAWMHVLGYFAIGDGAANGSWRSNFDLLGLIAPSTGARFGLMPSVYNDPWDGSSYLGAGVLALVVASAIAYLVRRVRGSRAASAAPGATGSTPASTVSWIPLIGAALGLAVFAATNDITIGTRLVARYWVPHPITALYEMFRGAARMIWPAYYVIFVAALWLTLRAWSKRAVTAVLAAAALLQLIDLAGVAAIKRSEVSPPDGSGRGLTRPLGSPIWPVIAQHYRRIVSVPAHHRQADWPTFALFAAQHGLGSNIGYLSRSDPAAREAGERAHLQAVATGSYDPDTVYYFPSAILWTVARSTLGPDDLALTADGFHLVVPGGRRWFSDRTGRTGSVASGAGTAETSDVPGLGTWLSFNEPDTVGLFLDGWSWPEPWGTWSSSRQATLVLPVPPHERVRVTFRWRSGAPRGRAPTLRLHLGDRVFELPFPNQVRPRSDGFELITTSRLLEVQFELSQLAQHPNIRPTGVGLIAARVQRASDPPDEEIPAAARGVPILDRWISFAAGALGRDLLVDGWSWGEPWGTWSNQGDSTLVVPVPPGQRLELTLRWLSTAPPNQVQSAQLTIDDQRFRVVFGPSGRSQDSAFQVTSHRGYLALHLAIDHPVIAADGRELGVGLAAIQIRLAQP